MRIIRKKTNTTALYIVLFIGYILGCAALYNFAQIQNIKGEIARGRAEIKQRELGLNPTIHSSRNSGQAWIGVCEKQDK
jgi:hypothetical protein